MKAQHIAIIGLIIVTVVIALPIASFLLLNSQWLKEQLEQKIQTSLNAELSIETLSFEVLKGQASLEGVTFARHDDASDLDLALQSAHMEVAVWPLLYRSIQIQYLELSSPQITSVVRRMPTSEEEPPETQEKKKPSKKRVDLLIGEFVVRDGEVDATLLWEGREPLHAIVTDIQYTATNVTPDTLLELLAGSDLHCQIALGSTTSILDKTGTASPATFSLKNVDLPYLNDYLMPEPPSAGQAEVVERRENGLFRKLITKAETFLDESTDPLRITSGTLDLLHTFSNNPKYERMTFELQNFQVAPLSESADQKFVFVPVERIIVYIDEREGNLTLDLELEQSLTMSPDLSYLVREVYKGFWIALLKEVSPDRVDHLMEKGAQKALDFLQNQDRDNK
jgi:hypothetical protein